MDVGVEAALPLAVAPDDAKQRKDRKKKKRPGEEGACDPYLTFSTLPPDFTLNHKVGWVDGGGRRPQETISRVWMDGCPKPSLACRVRTELHLHTHF